MSRPALAIDFRHIRNEPAYGSPAYVRSIMESLGVRADAPGFIARLPFAPGDATAGSETELQAVVEGSRSSVDLPLMIEQSNYFANITRRTASGDAPRGLLSSLERFLGSNKSGVWDNSWVRFPRRALGAFASELFLKDLAADKSRPEKGLRADAGRFTFHENGEERLRIPVSYLLKLALADAACSDDAPEAARETARQLLDHFTSDNTSPEVHSFYVVPLKSSECLGMPAAREASHRFLLIQLLVQYANRKFLLAENGQRVIVFNSPHPPVRQKELNTCISDSFYREMFMNPCLSGWEVGEAKHEYMHLCHRVLSRSQLNAVVKLKEAGIISSNLVVLPNMSNVSLANNGTHLTLGSRLLSEKAGTLASGFGAREEKHVGDLAIKIVEHFLPLFVKTYSAAPYRLDFADFHPEKVLGFLPHELDYTHLRMFWRRWRKKARLKILGNPVTPFGPVWLDKGLSCVFRLRGDFIPDFRLIDYMVSILSTPRSPALNGELHSADELKRDLEDMGIFSTKMALYLLYRLREFARLGFSGFEGRHYSLFENHREDMARAAELQTLVTALAFKYMALGKYTHAHIPDEPFIESERRQMIFGSAVNIPTFFVRSDTDNLFLKEILSRAERIRPSRRYPGYIRVHNSEYQLALLRVLKSDGADLIEMFGSQETLEDLEIRLKYPDQFSACGKLTSGVLSCAGALRPCDLSAEEFNSSAEKFYREDLRKRHIEEALDFLEQDVVSLEKMDLDSGLRQLPVTRDTASLPRRLHGGIMNEDLPVAELRRLIYLVLSVIAFNKKQTERSR